MTSSVKAIPDGYHTITPYICVNDAANAIEFYKKAFGATELMRLADPSGRIGHAEVKIGDSPIMFGEEMEGHRGPKSLGGTAVSLMIYVADVDRMFAQAVAAGGTQERAVADQFYGDRTGTLIDPFGHRWSIATHVEDVPAAEMETRMKKMASAG